MLSFEARWGESWQEESVDSYLRDDEAAWEVIDQISHEYTGGPYAVRTDRMLYLIEPENTWAWAAG